MENIGSSYSALNTRNITSTSSNNSTTAVSVSLTTSSVSDGVFAKVLDTLSKYRLAVPIALLGVLVAKSYIFDGFRPSYFRLIPQSVYISAMAGFLTLRLSIFSNEVAKEFKGEDFLGLVPGSLAIVLRKVLFNQDTDEGLEAVS